MKKLLFLLILFLPGFLFAGTSVIDVRTEGWGTITKTTGQNNLNGAMVWNGTEWVVNNTWAHKYFLDTRTGNRLKDPAVVNINNVLADEFDTLNYHIKRQNYTWSYPSKDGGTYSYVAVESVVLDKTTGKQIVLRSRGTGNGIGKAYFDIYVENEDTTGMPRTITALRNDPKWFNYTGMTMAQVLAQTDTMQYFTGNFPTHKGFYFLDVGGGGDLGPAGVGRSYIFHTDSLPPVTKTAGIVSSYPVDFAVRYMDSSGNIYELRFLPKLISETYIPLGTPTVTTDSISNVSAKMATVWGKVINDGGSPVTERGIVYSTSANPTTATGTKIKSGLGIGQLIATIHGLTVNTFYHVRAYAISSKGTAYGSDKSLLTDAVTPIYSTYDAKLPSFIRKETGEVNANGALVWNGATWVVNNTWAHYYFGSIKTKERLGFIEVIPVESGETDLQLDTVDYHVIRQNYTYTYPARNGGTYTYVGNEFVVQHKKTGKQTVLRSRGTGNGIGKAYFDIYIENEDTTGMPRTITAFRNDPKWFTYSGITMAQALAKMDTVQNLTGNLPTAGGWYFLDIGGGGDMGPAGVGKTYIFHTDSLPPVAKTAGIASSFPSDFGLRWMDSHGFNHQLNFLPKLISETYTPPVAAPVVATDSVSNVSNTSAKVWGTVITDGGSPVTERGIVFSTAANPATTTETKVSAGNGTGVFSANLTGLTANITYHVRAFAINAKGTSYGADKSFLATDAKLAVISSGLGTIRKVSGEANFNGAMVWNCKEWLVNNTYAHRTNTSPATGELLQKVKGVNISNSTTEETMDTLGYHITKRSYSWEFPAKDGGTYSFAAMEYVIVHKVTGRQVVLRSRGTGNGSAYFDIYAENEPGTCSQTVITAIRNGGLWFSYPGKTMEQALAQTSFTQNLAGTFTTPNGLYFLDMGCGGDMGPAGTGRSFVFHIGSQLPKDAKTADPGPSFPVDFGLRFMNSEGMVYELHFLPALIGEIYSSPVTLPGVTADSITAVTNTSATIWGNVTAAGGSPVTGRGIVFSTSVNPTLETGTKISAGTGLGPFSSTLTGLAGGAYFVRAYATNAKGTAYANYGRFETRNSQAIISTWSEGWGTILNGTGGTNPFGAMVWNGTEWVVNNTWMHKYFASVPSGKRLKKIETVKIMNSSASQVIDTLGFKITRGNYSYSSPAKDKGIYNYSAVEYTLENKSTGKQIALRSRGTGNGTTDAYFDIYIDNETTSGSSVTALRDGPNWFTWPGMTLQQALAQTNPTQGITGTLPTTGGWYFLDISNGADLGPAGVGRSFVFHSDSLHSASKTAGNGPSYPSDFAFRWMDATGNIHEFDFLPKLVSETYTAPFTVTTDSVNAILNGEAVVWGNVISGGGNLVTERGIVYSTSINPSIGSGTKISAGSGTGIFSVKISGLQNNKVYHARAFAISAEGNIYGDDRSFIPFSGFMAYKAEGTGNIAKNTGETNGKGALVWDCHGWQVNKSWEHRYLTNGITGDRLLSTDMITIPSGETRVVFDTLNFLITRESYTYSYPARDGGSYKYTVLSYLVKDTITGKQIALRSRGNGNGVSNAYFDIYLESITRSCSPDTITALRGDPLWFTYPGNTLIQAMAQTSATAGLTGSIPTTGGWYFMDVGGGGDIGPAGFGSSFTFHTATLAPASSKTSDLGSSYPSDFTIRMADVSGNLHELKFLPKLISETYVPYTGIGDLAGNKNTGIEGYPNPFTDRINVRGLKTSAVVSLRDISGRVLLIRVIERDGTIPANSLPAGMYILKIVTGDGSVDQKLIKN